MGNFFNMDNKLFQFLGRAADIMILNVVFVICCLPVVTIGASWTALYYVTLKMVKNEESYIVRSFLKSFKDNFKQSTVIWLILLSLGVILGLDIWIMLGVSAAWGKILLYVFFAILILYLFTLSYVFPLLARFDNTNKNTVKNAFLMSIRHLPWTVLLFLLTYLPLILFLFLTGIFFITLPLWLIAGFGLLAFISSYIFVRIFKNYMPSEESEEEFHVEASE